MRHQKRPRATAAAALVFLAAFHLTPPPPLPAWQWPTATPRLEAGYLDTVDTHYLPGIIVRDFTPVTAASRGSTNGTANRSNSNFPVIPVRPGRILLAVPPVEQPTSVAPPHVLNGFVLVEHDDAIRALYTHITPRLQGSPPSADRPTAQRAVNPQTAVDTTDTLGRAAGNNGTQIRLHIFDPVARAYLNPLLLLPPLQDRLLPGIREFTLRNHTYAFTDNYFTIEAEIFDRRLFVSNLITTLPPYVRLSYDNRSQTIVFDALIEDNGALLVASTRRLLRDTVTHDGRYLLGPFLYSDQDTITFSISDYRANLRTQDFSLAEEEASLLR